MPAVYAGQGGASGRFRTCARGKILHVKCRVVRPVAPRSAQPPNVSLSGIDDLVQGLAAAEADAAIETDGAVVLGGDLEKSAVHAGTLEAVQGLKQKGTSQAAAAMARHDSQVLNRAGAGPFAQAL